MTDAFTPQPDESVSDYALRMSDLVELIAGIVMLEAGIGIDVDDMMADARWLIALPDDTRHEIFALQQQIDRVIRRMTSATLLQRILYFAQEMSA